jgi:hypothetical protein
MVEIHMTLEPGLIEVEVLHILFAGIFSQSEVFYDIQMTPSDRPVLDESSFDKEGALKVCFTSDTTQFNDRYTEVFQTIKDLCAGGFEYEFLRLVGKDGESGLSFKYKARNGGMVTKKYVYPTSFDDTIPKDFLLELRYLLSEF